MGKQRSRPMTPGTGLPGRESVCERKGETGCCRVRSGCCRVRRSSAAPSHGGAAHHGTAHRQGLKGSPTLPISQGFLPPVRPRSQARLRQAPLHSGSNIPAQSSRYPERMALSSALPESRSKMYPPTDSPHCLLSSRSSPTFERLISENPAGPPLSCIPI